MTPNWPNRLSMSLAWRSRMALGISSFSIYILLFFIFIEIFLKINHLKINFWNLFTSCLFFFLIPLLSNNNTTITMRNINRGCGGGSRKNSWGNLSYAELITRAIESSAEQRLTLSQIYEWIVRYVPYFKEKYDRTSSAGWKVSSSKQQTPLYLISSILVFRHLNIDFLSLNWDSKNEIKWNSKIIKQM